jgi:hypothetical protein
MTNIKINTSPSSESTNDPEDKQTSHKASTKFVVDHSSDSQIANQSTAVINDNNVSAVPKKEHGGPKGLEPTRYGDWERKGRCVDF